jgi:hypothetical protein
MVMKSGWDEWCSISTPVRPWTGRNLWRIVFESQVLYCFWSQTMDVISVRRIRILSAVKFGFVVGGLVACLPSLLCGLLSAGAISVLYDWLQTWQSIKINLLVDTLEFNLVDLLRMDKVLTQLQTLDGRHTLVVLVLALGITALTGLFAALMTGVVGSAYNGIARLSGGIEIEVEEGQAGVMQLEPQRRPRGPTASLPPQPAMAWLVLAADPGRYWPLAQPVSRLGSQAGNDVILPFEGIDPTHAEVRQEEGRYILYDRSNGRTWVNGRPFAGRNLLKDGFQVRLGAVDFLFRQQGG